MTEPVRTLDCITDHDGNAVPGLQAEGEGFEPSIRLTTDNGFRDPRYALREGLEKRICALVRNARAGLPRRHRTDGGWHLQFCSVRLQR